MTQKYQVKVSMKQAAIVETGIVLKQGDFGMQIEIEVLDFDVTGTTPQIVFRKAMGAVESTTITVSGNKYTYTFVGTELDTPGKCFCDLKLKNSTTQRISTASFMFKVVADTLDGLAEEASSYSDTIAQIVGGFNDDISSLNTKVNNTKNTSKGGLDSLTYGILNVGGAINPTTEIDGYKLIEGGVESDSSRRLRVYQITNSPIYIKTQDGYQYRETTSASTTVETILGAYEGWVYPRPDAGYVAITFDKTQADSYGANSCIYETDTAIKNTERLETITDCIDDGVLGKGSNITPATAMDGYRIVEGGVVNDNTRRMVVLPISNDPIFIKTQDGYQYRETTSATTVKETHLGAYEGFVYPISGANYVAISFDKTNFSYIARETYYLTTNHETRISSLDSRLTTTEEKETDIFTKFEIAGRDKQIFNKFDYSIEKDIYINASDQLISYGGCAIITVKINSQSGDYIIMKVFDDTIYDESHFIGLVSFISNTIPSVGGSVLQSERQATSISNLRSSMHTASDATYYNLMFRFDTEAHREYYLPKIIAKLDVKISDTDRDWPDQYYSYYMSVTESIDEATRNYWEGKKIWWCGTSIPAGSDPSIHSEGYGLTYPEMVGQILGATVYNEALGSSMCRANVRTGDYSHALSHNLINSLSQTLEEKQYLIDNWSTIRQSLEDPNTYESIDSIADAVIGASFESRLMPYLDGTKPMPDLFVFDHGHNDWKTFYTMPDGTTPDTELKPTVANITGDILAADTYMTDNSNAKLISFFGEVSAIPSAKLSDFIASVNRNCFIGAVNFLCTLILSKNPRARIAFIGNLDNWGKPQVQPAQEYVASSWEFPLIKMWECTGFSEHYIPNTATYWESQGTQDLTVKGIYCKDGVHPHSDTTGESLEMYAYNIANALKNIR